MLKFGPVTCVVMLILGILAAGSEFRHRTIIRRCSPPRTGPASSRSRWLTNAASMTHGLSPTGADLVLAGYAIVLLVAASRTTVRRDLA